MLLLEISNINNCSSVGYQNEVTGNSTTPLNPTPIILTITKKSPSVEHKPACSAASLTPVGGSKSPMPNCTATFQPCQTRMDSKGMVLLAIATITEIASKPACPVEAKLQTLTAVQCSHPVSTMYRASDISRGRGPAKFRLFSEILRNSQKNAKYRKIR